MVEDRPSFPNLLWLSFHLLGYDQLSPLISLPSPPSHFPFCFSFPLSCHTDQDECIGMLRVITFAGLTPDMTAATPTLPTPLRSPLRR